MQRDESIALMRTQATKPNRRLNIAIGMSMLAFIISLGAWVFSVLYVWIPVGRDQTGPLLIMVNYGQIGVTDCRNYRSGWCGTSIQFPEILYVGLPTNAKSNAQLLKRLGFALPRYSETNDPNGNLLKSILLPFWLPTAIAFVLTTFLIAKKRRSKRLSLEGFCNRCRYDLTGNQSGTCPECGFECNVSPQTAMRRT